MAKNMSTLSVNSVNALVCNLVGLSALWLLPNAVLAQGTIVRPSDSVPPPASSGVLSNSVLSISGGERLMNEAMTAASRQNYDQAVAKFQDARQVFNQLSNFYQDLTASFTGIDNRIAETNRQKALQTANLRDRSTYQLALVYRAKNQPELAVPLLVQLIRSQAPTRELGQLAYQQLFELGFVDAAFPRPDATPAPAPRN
jgi:tetratricopeptide (TPR) repeat protein